MLPGLFKPEYLFRPRQLAKRLLQGRQSGFKTVRLPWGKDIRVSTDDNVGGQIATLGLYDLVITETLWRLCEPGESAIDVGANIGYTTFVMAQRLGAGRIRCYEPHPVIYQELLSNLALLRDQGCPTEIVSHQAALGPEVGELPLHVPQDFAYHRGESSLSAPTHLECASERVVVAVNTLDNQLLVDEKIGIMKMDVEGFELEVLRGAERTFSSKRVRDCVFEEHHTFPTPVTTWFESHGYSIFRLDRSFMRPLLLEPNSPVPRTEWTATNYLATVDPERVRARFAKVGWRCLGR